MKSTHLRLKEMNARTNVQTKDKKGRSFVSNAAINIKNKMKKVLTPKCKSRNILEFATIKEEAYAMHKFLLSYVSPKGMGSEGHLAIHHSQFSTDPYNFFVINPRILGAKDGEIAVIVNPEILEKDDSSRTLHREACMSFPFRSGINVKRNSRIKVKYQVPDKKGKGLEVKEEWVEDTMAFIFQHEINHAKGGHIYQGTKSH